MPDPLMYQAEHFVVLETNQPEQFLTAAELATKLQGILANKQADLPPELQRFPNVEAQVKYLINTSCDLDVGSGQYLQWYAVRLEK